MFLTAAVSTLAVVTSTARRVSATAIKRVGAVVRVNQLRAQTGDA